MKCRVLILGHFVSWRQCAYVGKRAFFGCLHYVSWHKSFLFFINKSDKYFSSAPLFFRSEFSYIDASGILLPPNLSLLPKLLFLVINLHKCIIVAKLAKWPIYERKAYESWSVKPPSFLSTVVFSFLRTPTLKHSAIYLPQQSYKIGSASPASPKTFAPTPPTHPNTLV